MGELEHGASLRKGASGIRMCGDSVSGHIQGFSPGAGKMRAPAAWSVQPSQRGCAVLVRAGRCLRVGGPSAWAAPQSHHFHAAKARECHHHCGVIAGAFPHGGGAEDLQGARGGGLREIPAGP